MTKIETITEEAEEEEQNGADGTDTAAERVSKLSLDSGHDDDEVVEWVKRVLEQNKKGANQTLAAKPALHAAPLDSISPVPSPSLNAGPTLG